ncbi:MAG: DUF4440 domain-containing protein [Gammaproteobacteria bacterium]|nr:DUF4440 domain-containing protein [Gammaproteobacteria bacterium]
MEAGIRLCILAAVLCACSRAPEPPGNPDTVPPQGVSLTDYVAANPLPIQTEASTATDRSRWGELLLDLDNRNVVSGDMADADNITDVIRAYHRAWLDQSSEQLRRLLAKDVVRVRQGRKTRGIEQAIEQAKKETRGERPHGYRTSMRFSIYRMTLDIRQELAVAHYSVAIHAGSRREFADIATVMQVLQQVDGTWQILAHIESDRLADHSTPRFADDVPSRRTPIRMDFVYPAKNLDRAIEFYSPLLGAPSVVTENRASFRLGDSFFELEINPLNRRVLMKEGYANGYAIVDVPHFGVINRWMSEREWAEAVFTDCGFDRCVITEDPSGNVIVWRRDRPRVSDEAVWPTVNVSPDALQRYPLAHNIRAMLVSWIATNADAVMRQLTDTATWIDDGERTASGEPGIRRLLEARWRPFVRGPDGIDADIVVRNLQIRESDDFQLATFTLEVDMRSDTRDSFRAHVLQLWSAESSPQVEYSFIARARQQRDAPVSNMDYTAYPVANLGAAGRYYKILFGAEPYRDDNWFGFWTTTGVFGLVGASSQGDSYRAIPHRANGYADFNVNSIEDTYAYLRAKGARFPLLPGINETPGIDEQPGYRQLLAIDSEGNLVNFSEHPDN